MKKWVALIFLVATAFSQQTNQDFWPASPGLNLGKSNQRWNANINNLNITGSCTINGASCLGSGTVTGATTNGGLVLTGHTLGMLKTCSIGQILSWNGSAWICTSTGSGLPAGLDTQVQINSGGGFGASPNFTFNLGTSTLSLSGIANISGPLTVTGALTNSALGPGGPFCVQENNGVFSSTGSACGSGGGGGTVTGSGTASIIPIWSTSTALGSSLLNQIGTSTVRISNGNAGVVSNTLFQVNQTIATASLCATGAAPAVPWAQNQCVGELISVQANAPQATGATVALLTSNSSQENLVGGIVSIASGATSGQTEIRSIEADAQPSSVGATTNRAFLAYAANVGGITGTNQGVYVKTGAFQGLGIITNNYSFYADSPTVTGTLTHSYGLYIADQTVGGGANNDPWGIFEAGSAKNQLGGSLTLAGIVGSTQCLHVNSVGLISGTGADCGSGGSTFPAGTGIPQVVGGSAWGTTLSVQGTGSVLLSSSATATSLICVTCNLGTPTALTLTAATGLPLSTGVTGTVQIANLGASGTPSNLTFLRGDNAWATPAGSGNVTGPGASTTHGIASYGDTTGTLIESNTLLATNVTSQTSNGAANQVCTYTGANKICVPGSVTVAMLATTATTVNSQTCTLGSTCTIPFQTATVNNTSQAGINLIASTTNAVGLTVTPVNSATNAVKFEITGGTYTGNAANLTPGAALSVSSITATTTNSTTLSGTFAGSPTFSGNPTFSGSPVFNMAGGPFCVQETAGVLSATASACGSGGGSISGTANALTYFATSSTVGSIASTVEGQLVVFHHTGPPTAVSPSLTDNGSTPIITTPYTIQCDSLTTLLDRGSTIRFTTGASVVTIPDSTGSGCAGLAAIIQPLGVSLTLNASGSDTFVVVGDGPGNPVGTVTPGPTTLTLTDGQFASINQAATGIWEIRVTQGGSVTSVATGAGLTGGPITTTGTISIPTSGVVGSMVSVGTLPLNKLSVETANSIVGNWTGSSASPTANAMASCSGNNNGEIYTTNTGLGCGTNFGQLNVASTWTALQTFGTNFSVGGVTATGATGTGNVVFRTSPTITSATLEGASTVVPSGATVTIQSGGSLVCAGGSTCPVGTGTVTHTIGSLISGRVVLGAGGADIQTGTATIDTSGNAGFVALTASGAVTFSAAGVASVPGLTISGAAYTAGTATTNFPQLYLNCATSTQPTSLSANGTQIGANPCTGWAGNFIDFHLNGGASLFSVGSTGNVLAAGTLGVTGAATLSSTLAVTGHTTFEGVTSTGATGTGNLMYSISPTTTGTLTGERLSFTTPSALGGSTTNNLIKGAASDTNTAAVLTVNSGTSSNQPIVDFKASNNTMFQVCNWSGPLGGTVFGANVTCANMTDQATEFGRNTFMTSLDQNLIREYSSITNQTKPFLEMNASTATGTGFNFIEGWTGVTATTTYHTGGAKVFSVDGTGSFSGNNGIFAGTLNVTGLATLSGGIALTGGLTSDSITCGVLNTTSCVITGYGSTSGTATFTWPAVAGTTTNAITSSNRISAPAFTSTVSVGTAPFVVTSTTNVANLNASSLSGATFAAPGTIGGTTPAAATFTTITANTSITCTAATCLGSATATTQAIDDNSTKVATTAYVDRMKVRAIPFNFGAPEGSALSTNLIRYVTVPFACTITGYNISADAGTATIKFWKVATGTALPTVSNVISTSGVALSTGTTVRSSTTSDFTSTTVTAGDIIAATNTATSSAKFLQAEIECSQ